MGNFLLLGIIAFAGVTTISHAIALLWAGRHKMVDAAKRERMWRWHMLVIGNLWRILALLIVAAQAYFFNGFSIASLFAGIVFILFGLYLSAASYFALGGIAAAMGERFFFPEKQRKWIKSGFYKYLANPMYDGFLLLLIGLGLAFQAPEDYYLAAASFILLNVVLAFTESKGHGWKPF